jgi:signal transduction histidine kinase
VLTALVVKLLLDRVVDTGAPFLLFPLAILVAAWFGGLGPGLFATVLGTLLGVAASQVPESRAGVTVVRGLVFVLQGIGISLIAFALQRAQRRAEEDAARARATSEELTRHLAERQRAEEAVQAARAEAETANRMKDQFLATLSHELRTPLNAIFGWAQLLRTGRLDPATIERGVETIERNARAQKQLIDDLLDVSRIISGKLRLDVQPVEPAEVVEAALETVVHTAQAKGVVLQRRIHRTGHVLGDPQRLQQVVWNLLSNAVKFTPKGGEVRVTAEVLDGHARISVADTGQGIAPEFLPHVFDRFRQADRATTRTATGLGLGLAIARQIGDLHGRTIRAESPVDGGAAVVSASSRPLRPARSAPARARRAGRRGESGRI